MPTVIEATARTPEGKNANRRIRQSGRIPAVIYGRGKASMAVSVDPVVIWNILHSDAGRNTIFNISVDGSAESPAMVKDYQRHPVKGNLLHVDLMEIAMDRRLVLSVNVELQGEARGVKLEGGILDFVTRAIDIECLPADIPESIKVDVSQLKINDYVRVRDLDLGDKVVILSEPDVVVVTVAPPAKEEVPDEEAAPDEPEVDKQAKGEEGAAEGKKDDSKKPESK
ncbi:MAG: 50S ribosomal protein L25 [Acidobacteriota bacterium]|jgi:large subunit ribosomal protein L25|nr:50S ribosomal protein L25 [Acidobacteriota bacterium]NLT33682.1 50S ribosomal protein L25 [Acidobacteriota bacterium]